MKVMMGRQPSWEQSRKDSHHDTNRTTRRDILQLVTTVGSHPSMTVSTALQETLRVRSVANVATTKQCASLLLK